MYVCVYVRIYTVYLRIPTHVCLCTCVYKDKVILKSVNTYMYGSLCSQFKGLPYGMQFTTRHNISLCFRYTSQIQHFRLITNPFCCVLMSTPVVRGILCYQVLPSLFLHCLLCFIFVFLFNAHPVMNIVYTFINSCVFGY